MGTDPSHEKRGAASLLLQWGIDQCKRHHVPGYLESTVEAAPFYEKRGFARMGTIAQDISPDHNGNYEVYQETSFVFFPGHHGH
jgi:GNAT superfamily N-acetyltransferase